MRIEGPYDRVREYIPQLIAVGATGVFIRDKSELATLDFSIGSVDSIFDGSSVENPPQVWEYITNEVEKDIMETDIAAVNAVNGTADEKILRKAINGTELTSEEESGLSVGAAAIYADIKAGVRSVRVYVPTVRVSRTVSSSYQTKAANTNVGSILTTATLASNEGIPAWVLFTPPAYTTSKPNRAWGWFKKPPSITNSGGIRSTISQEWEYGLWSTTLYGAPI